MLTNNKLRTLFVALPTVALMACTSSGPTDEELQAEQERLERERQEQAAAAEEQRKAQAEAAAAEQMRKAREMAAQEKAALEAQNTIYFDFDRSTIKSEFESVLRKHAEYLVKNADQTIVIDAHLMRCCIQAFHGYQCDR